MFEFTQENENSDVKSLFLFLYEDLLFFHCTKEIDIKRS